MALVLEKQLEGKYEILGKIREGGMGAVYKVRHRLLGETRVVKVLHPRFEASAELNERFLREARLAIQLRHPNIAQLHDLAVSEDGTAFIVMEFIDGATLEDILQSTGPLPLGVGLEFALQALKALGFLHRRGFVHRDIAPDNLMLSRDLDGEPAVKLIDLGIAKILQGEPSRLTSTGLFLGKPRYASPEHFGAEGAEGVDGRSDLYSFGVVLYELLTGHCPIQGRDPSSFIAGHLLRPPLDFAVSDPDGRLPGDLREVLLRSLAKEPRSRFGTAEEFGEALQPLRRRFGFTPDDLERILATALDQTSSPPAPVGGTTQERLDGRFAAELTPAPEAWTAPVGRREPTVRLRLVDPLPADAGEERPAAIMPDPLPPPLPPPAPSDPTPAPLPIGKGRQAAPWVAAAIVGLLVGGGWVVWWSRSAQRTPASSPAVPAPAVVASAGPRPAAPALPQSVPQPSSPPTAALSPQPIPQPLPQETPVPPAPSRPEPSPKVPLPTESARGRAEAPEASPSPQSPPLSTAPPPTATSLPEPPTVVPTPPPAETQGPAAGGALKPTIKLVFLKDGSAIPIGGSARPDGQGFAFTTASGLELKVNQKDIDMERTVLTHRKISESPGIRALSPSRVGHVPSPVVKISTPSAQIQGVIRVAVLIDSQGKVAQAKLASESLPSVDEKIAGSMRAASLEAAWKAQFTPARLWGQPLKTWDVIQFRFNPPTAP